MSHVAAALTAGGAAAAAIGALTWTIASPTNTLWGPIHSRGRADNDGAYALTFDDGPTEESTPRILDILGELNVRAAFFVIGVNARRRPDLLRRMFNEGHVVGNHSLDHAHLALLRGPWYWDSQLRKTDEVIQQTLGVRPAMFRPPMGIKTPYVMGAAARRKQAVVTWSRRAVDGISTTSARILNRLLPHTQPGEVLLLHDGVEPNMHRDAGATVAAIKPLVLGLRERGREPMRVDLLLDLPAYVPEPAETQIA